MLTVRQLVLLMKFEGTAFFNALAAPVEALLSSFKLLDDCTYGHLPIERPI